jgi:hypothetical protein
MRRTLALLALAGLLGGAPAALAQDAPAPGAGGGTLDLSIRARSLGLVPDPPGTAPSLGLETMTAPTGAGTTRWPSARTEVARGVYISVEPLCLPGADPLWPRYPGARRR